MAELLWTSACDATVAQITAAHPNSDTETGDVWTVNLKDDVGNAFAISITGAADDAAAAAALVTAAGVAKTEGNQPWTEVTAAVLVVGADDNFQLTADSAGIPFYMEVSVAAAVASAWVKRNPGDAGYTTLTWSRGPNDWMVDANFDPEQVPVENDTIRIPSWATGAISYGLRSNDEFIDWTAGSIPKLGGFVSELGNSVIIGNSRQPLMIALDGDDEGNDIRLAGTGQKFLELEDTLAANTTDIFINESAPSSGEVPGTSLSATSTTVDWSIYIRLPIGGSVGLAALAGEAMKVNVVNLEGTGTVFIGSGCTGSPVPTVVSGILHTYCTLGNVISDGTWTHYSGDSGTIDLQGGITTLLSEDLTLQAGEFTVNAFVQLNIGPYCAKTQGNIVNVKVYGAQWILRDPWAIVTEWEFYDCQPGDGQVTFPKNRQLTVAAIS